MMIYSFKQGFPSVFIFHQMLEKAITPI